MKEELYTFTKTIIFLSDREKLFTFYLSMKNIKDGRNRLLRLLLKSIFQNIATIVICLGKNNKMIRCLKANEMKKENNA